ncbi:hypothetical protein ACQBAT_05535 [Ornithinimicrobium sp. Y1847]|uniref:hypothetical protein n=1 Tax=unclassified Ornithinimicrobium TaxID=2615080 RepID=UPI003B67FB2B
MSQMTVSARLGRVSARPASLLGLTGPLGGSVRADRRTRVQDAAPAVGHIGFMVLCLMIVVATFSAVLVLNTLRAEGSFVQSRLAAEATELHDTKVTLQSELAMHDSSEALATKARKLKMVPSTSTATLRLSDGQITGVASMVDGNRTLTVDLPSTGVATKDR